MYNSQLSFEWNEFELYMKKRASNDVSEAFEAHTCRYVIIGERKRVHYNENESDLYSPQAILWHEMKWNETRYEMKR